MLRHRQLADIVQQSRRLQGVQFLPLQADLPADLRRIYAHALQMLVRGRILRFNRERQCFDRPKMKSGQFLHVHLCTLNPIEIHAIRAVNEVNQRE